MSHLQKSDTSSDFVTGYLTNARLHEVLCFLEEEINIF